MMAWLEQLQNYHGPPLVLALLICSATLLSEDLACIAAGILAAKGWLPLPLATASAALGIWIGDCALYGLGKLSQTNSRHWRWLDRLASTERIARGRSLFERFGTRWIFLSRFLPGIRVPSYLAAGAVGWSFPRFATTLAIAVLIWTPFLVGLAYFLGQKAATLFESYQRWAWPILITSGLLLFITLKLVLPLFSWRGRRLLAGKWRRLTHWEYWPPLVVYPLALWPLLFRRLRGGGLLDFLSCNPAMPLSGFAMESKGDILDGFSPPHPQRVRIADYLRFTTDGEEAITTFAAKYSYPLVLKPDIGERGSGVAVIRSWQGAQNWLSHNKSAPAMVQEYIPGLEVGIHWAILPGEAQGTITSLARKVPQHLVGNGQDTVEELVLRDPRAAAMAKHFLEQFALRLTEVPARGEKLILTELGTHCLGAIFEDARDWITPELTQALDEIGTAYEGFHFGRYDIRVPSEKSLKRGEGLVILELNGVTGEPAHIYQPDYPLRKGIADLRKHYQLAGQIGRSLPSDGHPPATWKDLLRVTRAHAKKESAPHQPPNSTP